MSDLEDWDISDIPFWENDKTISINKTYIFYPLKTILDNVIYNLSNVSYMSHREVEQQVKNTLLSIWEIKKNSK